MRLHAKIVCKLLLLFILLSAGVLLFANFSVKRYSCSFVYADASSVPECGVALVLGAKVWPDGRISDILHDRLMIAVELYKNNKVRKIIVSGDHGTENYDEVNTMKNFLVSNGVQKEDVFLDHAGFCTYDSCYRAKHIFGVSSVVIVTNEFHLPRALFLARNMGLNAVGCKSDLRAYDLAGYHSLRESVARCKDWLNVKLFNPYPRFLGPKIDISGDGKVTDG
ncbi:MAG: YdcF family protein [Planctomycetes bacterium]|nr:YdcF family protein [Planctomycetota bacterium]